MLSPSNLKKIKELLAILIVVVSFTFVFGTHTFWWMQGIKADVLMIAAREHPVSNEKVEINDINPPCNDISWDELTYTQNEERKKLENIEYYLEISRDNKFEKHVKAMDWEQTLSHKIEKLPGGNTYYYRVKARYMEQFYDDSKWSDVVACEVPLDEKDRKLIGMSDTELLDHEPILDNSKSLHPEQLFDIIFEIDNPIIEKTGEIQARLMFESFGSVPTPVEINYSIRDVLGTELFSKTDNITVETESVYNLEVEELDLQEGEYFLVASTLYDTDVYDEFKIDVTIEKSNNTRLLWYIFDGFFLLIVVIYIVKRIRKK